MWLSYDEITFCLFLNHLHTLTKKLNNLQNQLQGLKQTLREFFSLCALV